MAPGWQLRRPLWRLCLGGSLAHGLGAPLAVQAQGVPPRVSSERNGRVISGGDGGPVAAALVQQLRTGVRVRTDQEGQFRLLLQRGDTLAVRALGFQRRDLVVDSGSLRIVLTPTPTVLPGLTTTMGQRVIRASESPRSVTILGRDAIDAAAAVAVNQLLRQLPGLQELPAAPSKSSISIRGFDDSRVLVLVDGEPVAGALVESRDIGRLSSVGTERIEVTKGPSSVEFGSDALGGVINIVRAAPSQRLSTEWMARQGGLGRRESNGGVSQTVGRLGYRLTGGWRQSDRVTGYDAAIATFHRVYDARADLRYALGKRWTARLDLQGTQERQRFPVDARFNGFIDNRGGQGFTEVQGPLKGGTMRMRAVQQRFG